MGFQNKAYELNFLVVLQLQIELQLKKIIFTCFVFIFHYVSYTSKLMNDK
jgi:hypothetical protein